MSGPGRLDLFISFTFQESSIPTTFPGQYKNSFIRRADKDRLIKNDSIPGRRRGIRGVFLTGLIYNKNNTNLCKVVGKYPFWIIHRWMILP
jgi:hypothetical protein